MSTYGVEKQQLSILTPGFSDSVTDYLKDPSNLPPEFKNWITAWVEAFPPNIPFSQVSGYSVATTYAEVTTPSAIASGTSPVAVTWTAKRKDAASMWTSTKLVAKQAGVYSCSAFIDWGTNATGTRNMWLRLNGATNFAGDNGTPSANGCPMSAKGLIDMQVNDYIEVTAQQNSGGSITPSGFFTAVRVSPL